MKIIQADSEKTKSARPGGKVQTPPARRMSRLGGKERQSEDMLIHVFHKYLDDRYHLLRNVELEELEFHIPMVLVGPPGIQVISPLDLRGVCRIHGDKLECMDKKLKHYSPVKPDYVEQLLRMGSAINARLMAMGYDQFTVDPVLIFTDVGLHIELVNPAVRVVIVDALDRYMNGLLYRDQRISWAESQALIRTLTGQHDDIQIKPEELVEDEFSLKEKTSRQFQVPDINIPLPEDQRILGAMKKVPFSSRQLVFLSALILINILILIAFVFVILILK